MLPSRTRLAPVVLALALVACSGGAGPSDAPGLRAGTYDSKFELYRSISTPDALVGKHEFTFRVVEPATSVADVQLLSSRLTPDEGPAIRDYLVLDPEMLRIEADEWRIRFPYAEGSYAVSITLQDLGNGSFRIDTTCFARSGSNAYLGASCLVERR